MRSIARVSLACGIGWSVLCGSCAAEEKNVFSGPQTGEEISEFHVLQIINSEKSNEVQITPKTKGTTFLIFLHKVTEPAIGLMITLEWFAHKQKGLDSHYVLLTDDKPKTEQMAKRWSQRPFFASSPWCISLDGIEGPGRYGLNRNVMMTVLVAKDNAVVSSFALTQPNNTDAPKLLAALAKALDKPAPSYKKIREELAAERQRRREQRLTQNPVFKLAPNPELGRLMLAIVYREGINEEYVQKASRELVKWAGDDKEKNAALARYCKAVLKGNFEINRYSRAALRKLAGEQ